MQAMYDFDGVHLENEITTDFLKKSRARMQGVTKIKKAVKEDLQKKNAKEEKEEDYERSRKGIY